MMMLHRNRSFIRAAFYRGISVSTRATSTAQTRTDASSKASSKGSLTEQKKLVNDPNVINLDNLDIVTRSSNKLKARDPLVKNFFIAVVDREMLAYPEVLEKEELNNIVQRLRPISKHFAHKERKTSPKDLLNDSKEMKLFAGNVPELYGGLGYLNTETYLAQEAESVNASDALILNANRSFIETIREHGNDEQQKRFLRKMGKSELTGTISLIEENNSNDLSTKAEWEDDGNEWVLNGAKEYVINAANADFLIVGAQTNTRNFLGDNTETMTAFIVDLKQPGVTVHAPNVSIGCNGINQARVSFKNVKISASNVILEPGKGHDILGKLTMSSRLQAAVLNVTQMKKILNYLILQCNNTKFSSEKLSELSAIRDAIGHAACAVYATESMIYMTTSLPDIYDKPDIDLETAIVKVYSQKKLLEIATLALDFLGIDLVAEGHVIESAIRDAVQLHVMGEPNEILKLYIGSTGLQHCGQFLQDDIKKTRNPMYHPEYIFRRIFKHQSIQDMTLKLKLIEHLHPSLDVPATHLELSVGRLRHGCDITLTNHGRAALEKHVDILRLGESAIEIYALFCTLARVSRSYCIGLRHAEYERLIATCIAHSASEKVLHMMMDIENGPMWAYDAHYDKLTEHLFFCKEYFPEHPLTRNF